MQKYALFLLFSLLSAMGFSANATGLDLSSLTSAVDFTTIIAAVLLVFAAVAGFDLAWVGGKAVLRAIRGR